MIDKQQYFHARESYNRDTTIVIPTFNRANMLKRCIESCLEQTIKCEIIICDHGSTDNTPDVVRQFGDKVTYIRREKDLGPIFCWLEGCLHATGNYIHLQYDDDYIVPTFIEETLQLMNPSTGFVYTVAHTIDNDNVITSRQNEQMFLNLNIPLNSSGHVTVEQIEKLVDTDHHCGNISPACVLLRKSDAIDSLYCGKLPHQTNNDTYHGAGADMLMTRTCMLRYSNVGIVNKPLAIWSDHPDSITNQATKDSQKRLKLKHTYNTVRQYYYTLKNIK